MAITVLPDEKVIELTSSITDLAEFHQVLRQWEASDEGVTSAATHTWQRMTLANGAAMLGMDLVNGWRLRFPVAGRYTIVGNLNGDVLTVAGVFVERQTSVAFVTSFQGGGGGGAVDAQAVAQALRDSLAAELAAILQIQTRVDAAL